MGRGWVVRTTLVQTRLEDGGLVGELYVKLVFCFFSLFSLRRDRRAEGGWGVTGGVLCGSASCFSYIFKSECCMYNSLLSFLFFFYFVWLFLFRVGAWVGGIGGMGWDGRGRGV